MADRDDIHRPFPVRNLIDHAPITDADPVQIPGAFNLDNTLRTRIRHQRLDLPQDPARYRRIKRLQLLARRARKRD